MISVENGLITIALVALFVELLSFIINNVYLNPPETFEEKRLAVEVRRLNAEAKALEGSPAVFLEFARVGREAAQKEVKIKEIRTERESRKNTKAGKLAAQVLYVLLPLPMAFAYFFWIYFVSELEPVAHVPEPGWVWPMAHLLALPNQPPNGSISSIGWMFLCRRVFARIFDLVLPK